MWIVVKLDWISKSKNVFCKKGVLRNFAKFTRKHLCQGFFFNKVEALTQVFSCEFCEISTKTFFTEHLWATASAEQRHQVSWIEFMCEFIKKSLTHSNFLKRWRSQVLLWMNCHTMSLFLYRGPVYFQTKRLLKICCCAKCQFQITFGFRIMSG